MQRGKVTRRERMVILQRKTSRKITSGKSGEGYGKVLGLCGFCE